MAESITPTKMAGKLDTLPKEELIKYVKKQANQMKDLKRKNEDLTITVKHQKEQMEKLEQEQKAWISRGVSAEFEKKEELEKKERELQIAAQLGQQMLQENDKLRNRCIELEEENKLMREEMSIEIARLDGEKETVDQTLVMVQSEYKQAKMEAQQLKDALELAAADHDKEHERWEEETQKLKEAIMELQKGTFSGTSAETSHSNSELNEINKALQTKIDELQEQLDSFAKQECAAGETIAENQELRTKLEADSVEMKAQNESLNFLRKKCDELGAKNEELHQYVNMLSTERNESNTYSKQLDEEIKKLKEEKDKMARSVKTAKGKLEKAATHEEELKAQLNSFLTEKSELQLMVKNLQREKKTIMQSNKNLQVENEELRKEINSLKMKLEIEEGEIGSLENVVKDLTKQKVDMIKEFEIIKERLIDTEKDLTKRELENEDDKASSLKLQSRVDELLSTLQSLNEEKMHQESEIEELFKTHDELQVKYDNECRSKMESEQKVKNLEEQLEKQEKSLEVLNEELSLLKSGGELKITRDVEVNTQQDCAEVCETSTLKAEIAEKCQIIIELNSKIQEMEDELETERQEIKILQSNFREKVSSVEEFEENEKQIANINEESKQEMEFLRAELEDLRRTLCEKQSFEEGNSGVHSLQEEIDRLRLTLNEKEAAIKCVEKDKCEILEELRELKGSYDCLTAKKEERDHDAERLEEEKRELLEEIEKLSENVKEKDAAIGNLESELDAVKAKESNLVDEVAKWKGLAEKDDQRNSNEPDKYKKGYKKIKEKFNEVGALNEKLKQEIQAKNVELEELKKGVTDRMSTSQNLNGGMSEETENSKYSEILNEKILLITQLKDELKMYKEASGCEGALTEKNEVPEKDGSIEGLNAETMKQAKKTEDASQLSAECGAYEQKCSGLEAKVEQLTRENEEVEKILEKVRKELGNRDMLLRESKLEGEELRKKADELIKVEEHVENLSRSIDEERRKFSHLEEEKRKIEIENNDNSLIIKELKENIKEKENNIVDLKNRVQVLEDLDKENDKNKENEFLKVKKTIEDLQRRLEGTLNEIEMQKTELQEKQTKIIDLENRLLNLEEHCSSQQVEFDAEKTRLKQCVKDNELLLSEKEELSIRLSERISSLEEKEIEMEKYLRNETEKFEYELKVSKEEGDQVIELKNELEIVKSAFDEQDRKIKDYEALIKEKDESLSIAKEELASASIVSEKESMANNSEKEKMVALDEEIRKAREKIVSLETSNKQMTDKVSKFKSVAIKAKKEIDSVKEKTSNEKQQLEDTILALKKDIQCHKDEFENQSSDLASLKQKYEEVMKELNEMTENADKESNRCFEYAEQIKTLSAEVDKLQVSIASLENQKASLEVILKEKEESSIALASQLNEVKGEKSRTDQLLMQEKESHEAIKTSLAKTLEVFEIAKKNVHQMKMISLEMEDYQRTVESMQAKLADRENECEMSNKQIKELQIQIEDLNKQIASLEDTNNNISQQITNLTSQLLQREDELAKLLIEKQELESKENGLKQNIEDVSRKCEEGMIQISELTAEREKALLQLKKEKDAHQKDVQSAELKFSRASTELSLLQEAYNNCKQEFESYKIRAQNVLKQQKMKNTDNGESHSAQDRSRLEDTLNQLKERLVEANTKLTSTTFENEELEAEHEKLQRNYDKLVEVTNSKEHEWRNRFAELQKGSTKQLAENEDKIASLSQENDSLKTKLKGNEEYEAMAQDYEKTIKELQDQIRKMQKSPKRVSSKDKKTHVSDGSVKEHKGTPEKLKLSFENTTEGSNGLVERPGAEGMDSSELEAIDKSSLPATPVSTEAVNILERILSPTEQQTQILWPTSPTAAKEEGLKLRSTLATAEKNVEHLSVLLAETEGSNVRLSEQIKVLKTEIRRMQKNQEREEALSNLEYLKNVIIKFMKCGATERECMVPVLTTMLKLNQEEKQFITEFAKGEADQGEDPSGWSSYVYRWTSFS
ncbi:GRIP and coiled-coil domain-containing protein 2-like isoform X2 [Rhopilema esculentum]|uniref:GRIP and coiled-coil domain-containing protein 2-like isoform X2 n=1 Tax=Rhopilema esculentum TaxID=499914 RepID=UPI0031D5CEBB